MKHHLRLLLLLPFLLLTQGCGVYSLSGTSIAPDVNTISVANFYNDAGQGPPNLSQDFTEDLKGYYQRNTNLSIVNEQGDLQVLGSIVQYQVVPAAPVSGDVSASNRLTIGVRVEFINTKDESQNFEQTFSFFRDYPQTTSLQDVEQVLIDEITEQIILDIFNKTVANW